MLIWHPLRIPAEAAYSGSLVFAVFGQLSVKGYPNINRWQFERQAAGASWLLSEQVDTLLRLDILHEQRNKFPVANKPFHVIR